MFPKHHNATTLSILQDRGQQLTVEIFPHRWTCAIPFEEAVMVLIADSIRHKPYHTWSPEGYTHPWFEVRQGGVFFHAGEPGPDAFRIEVRDDRVVLQDGRVFDAARFATAPYQATTAQAAYDALFSNDAHLAKHPHAAARRTLEGVVAGAAQCLLGHGYHDWAQGAEIYLQTTPKFVGVVAQEVALVQKNLDKTGKAAKSYAFDTCSTIAKNLIQAWILRPDRGWAPRVWTGTDDLQAYAAALDPLDVLAGQTVGAYLRDEIGDGKKLSTLFTNEQLATGHLRLERKAIEAGMMARILEVYAADPTRLKPRAAAKAAKTRR